MYPAYVVLTIVTAAANLAGAAADFLRVGWVIDNMGRYGVPASWIVPLGVAKAAGGIGLLAGLAVPAIGIAAAVGLLLYFAGAVVTVARARWYVHLPFPSLYLLAAAAVLTLRLTAV